MSPVTFIAWALTVGVMIAELAIPLAFAFWLGRRYERRLVDKSVSDEAAAWLETHDRRARLDS